MKLNANQLGGLPIRDGDVISAVSFFANPAGGQAPTIIVDGMERTDSVSISPSQVQEVRLNNNAYSAEFPKPGKDRIEIDTKGGTDTFHGGFVFRTRNSVFDARNPLAASKPPFARSGYEANLDGPILKKRLFFFVDADRENSSARNRGCGQSGSSVTWRDSAIHAPAGGHDWHQAPAEVPSRRLCFGSKAPSNRSRSHLHERRAAAFGCHERLT